MQLSRKKAKALSNIGLFFENFYKNCYGKKNDRGNNRGNIEILMEKTLIGRINRNAEIM